MQPAITLLEIEVATMENNIPINEAAGNVEQAALERANAESYRAAITALRAI